MHIVLSANNSFLKKPKLNIDIKNNRQNNRQKIVDQLSKEAHEACLLASTNIHNNEALQMCIEKSIEHGKHTALDDSY